VARTGQWQGRSGRHGDGSFLLAVLKSGSRRAGFRRQHAALLRALAERHALATVRRGLPFREPRILCYHSVGTAGTGINDVAPGKLRRQLELVRATGGRFVAARRIAEGAAAPHDLAVTFDDGFRSVTTNAWPVLRELAVPATMFVVAEWADRNGGKGDERYAGWADFERMAAAGVSIGSHSCTHRRMAGLPMGAIVDELQRSRALIEQRIGIRTDEFAIPFGQASDWSDEAMEAAREAGYRHVYAQSALRRPPGTVTRTFITSLDNERVFRAALRGAFDGWEEWY
jgi:peptidoglycan/xylan/chitin deacetylase (PgdA/CDA1 family)